MQDLWFWNSWEKKERSLYIILLGIFLFSAVYMFVQYYQGTSNIISWDILSIKEVVEVPADRIDHGPVELEVPGENYVLSQQFFGSRLKIDTSASGIHLAAFIIFIVVMLTLFTHLSRGWYMAGMILFIGLMLNFKLEQLMLFGSIEKTGLIIAFLVVIPVSYYFQSIRRSTPFMVRFVIFALIAILFGLAFRYFSGVSHPDMYITNYGILGALVLTAFFILTVSHEVLYGFLAVITGGAISSGGGSLRHFVLISSLYLANVILLFLREAELIRWDFFYFNHYWLLFFSSVIGIWGFRQRKDIYGSIFSFRPFGALYFIALAILSFTTIGYFHATGNDSILEVIKDFILYGHLGFGVIFFVYIISNFIYLLNQNMEVYKVVYSPKTMPYFTFRLAGYIAVIALFLQANWKVPWNHSISGYYNGIGDLYTLENDALLAQYYYNEGSVYGVNNHRSNYALASLAEGFNETENAIFFYKKAVARRPSEFSFVNLSNAYQEEGNFFEALFTLREGLAAFPESGPILNNFGLLMGKTNVLDSALIYLDRSTLSSISEETAATNYYSVLAKSGIVPDSLPLGGNKFPLHVATNLLLIGNQGSVLPETQLDYDIDSTLNLISSAYIHNRIFSLFHTGRMDIAPLVEPMLDSGRNPRYSEQIEQLYHQTQYYTNQITKAIPGIESLAGSSYRRGPYYYNMLGLWALEQGRTEMAMRYFEQAIGTGSTRGMWHKALLLLNEGKLDEARDLMANLFNTGNYPETSVFLKALRSPLDSLGGAGEDVLYTYIWIHHKNLPEPALYSLISRLPQSAQMDLLLDLADLAVKSGNTEDINRWLTLSGRLETITETQFQRQAWLYAQYLVRIGEYNEATDVLVNLGGRMELNARQKSILTWLGIREDPLQADSIQVLVVSSNAFFAEGVITGARVLQGQGKTQEAYDLLLEAKGVNSSEPDLLKEYALQSLRSGFTSYGRIAMDELKPMIGADDWNSFKQEFEKLEQELERWEE